MKSIVNLSLSANGSPSDVKARIQDQLAGSTGTAEETAAFTAIRAFVEKAISGASEDDTLTVKGSFAIVVSDAPATVVAKAQATADQIAGLKRQLEDSAAELKRAQDALVLANTPAPAVATLPVAPVLATTLCASGCGQQVVVDAKSALVQNADGSLHSCPPKV